jgi:general secretion pathway protein G
MSIRRQGQSRGSLGQDRGSLGGFTLLELIVVITIIGFLSAVVVVTTKGLPAKGRKTKINQDLRAIVTVAEAIYTDTGRYPESIESMVNFKNEDGTTGIAGLERYPKDPWGHEYLYEITSDGSPRVTCLGSDNQPGGDGEGIDTVLPSEEEGQ